MALRTAIKGRPGAIKSLEGVLEGDRKGDDIKQS